MKRSTAKFIAYNLRPSKQAERRILLDFLKCANEAGINISDCRYVGMGGTSFYDFHLMHRFLGVKTMISLERDENMYKRSIFNCPYKFIRVQNDSVSMFINGDKSSKRTIYWLDYDDGISAEITADITALGARIKLGSFAFVTVCGDPPGALLGQTEQARLNSLSEVLGPYAAGLRPENMQKSQFPDTVHGILLAAFANAFAARRDGRFLPLMQIQYTDSSPMVTVGGCFCTQNESDVLAGRVTRDLQFLVTPPQPYHIKYFNLTERERALFDIAVTRKAAKSRNIKTLENLGFKDGDFKAYKELIRFLPRYFESII